MTTRPFANVHPISTGTGPASQMPYRGYGRRRLQQPNPKFTLKAGVTTSSVACELLARIRHDATPGRDKSAKLVAKKLLERLCEDTSRLATPQSFFERCASVCDDSDYEKLGVKLIKKMLDSLQE